MRQEVDNYALTLTPHDLRRRQENAMAFVPAPRCAEAIIELSTPGGTALNVLNFQFGTSYNQGDLNSLASAVDVEVGGQYVTYMNNESAYDQIHVRGLAATVDLEAFSNTYAGAGQAATHPLPDNVAFCVSLRTGLTGRSARGRFYAAALDSSALSGGDTVSTTYANGIVSLIQNIQTAALTQGWQLVIISRQNNLVPRTTAVAYPVSVVEYTDLFTDSQRRRLKGRGI